MAVDIRKTGMGMVGAGAVAMTVGIVADAVRHADDPTLASRHGIFDLSSGPHALFFGGIAVAVLGLFALAGARLYRPGSRVTVVRRLGQVVAPVAALALVAGCAAIASNSDLGTGTPPATDEDGTAAVAASESTAGHSHDEGTGEHSEAEGEAGHEATAAVVAPKPYDPNLPIDLSGVEGVTAEQQARAENLIAATLKDLPQFADPAAAEAAGFKSIGDALTGEEHYINVAYFDDGRTLDPDYPESLVYRPDEATGGKKLVAAMYMLAPDTTLADVPDIGGPLTQWHIHNNLCFNDEARVVGLTNGEGECGAGLNKGSQAPMIHVWIVPHRCGPFAALDGVGGGQIAEGETKLCDTAHGHSG